MGCQRQYQHVPQPESQDPGAGWRSDLPWRELPCGAATKAARCYFLAGGCISAIVGGLTSAGGGKVRRGALGAELPVKHERVEQQRRGRADGTLDCCRNPGQPRPLHAPTFPARSVSSRQMAT